MSAADGLRVFLGIPAERSQALRYKTKLLIDHTLGVVFALVFKGLAKILTHLLGRDHGVPEAPACVAVGKLVGLGSIVYSGTLCRGLRARYPQTRIVYVTSRANRALVERFAAVDDVLCLDDRNALHILFSGMRLVLRLWRLRPELYFDLEVYSSFAAILASLSLARNRYGFYRRSAGFKRNLHTHMIFFNTRRHIAEIYGQMLLCVEAQTQKDLHDVLAVRESDREACSEVLSRVGVGERPLVLVNPNASELMLERRWPRERWVEFLTAAVARFPEYEFLLVGAPAERDYVAGLFDRLGEQVRGRVRNVAGEFSLPAFFGLIGRCSLLVTNDSGPLHLAVALGTPSVSLWGPGAPDHYMPLDGRHEVIWAHTYCSPCLYHADFPPCEGDNVCMKQTPVETVLECVERILGARPEEQSEVVRLIHEDLRDINFSPVILHGRR